MEIKGFFFFFARSRVKFISYIIFCKSTQRKLQNIHIWPSKWKCISAYFIYAEYEWKVPNLIFKNNCAIIYAFTLMLFFKIVTYRSKTLIPMMPLFKTFWKTSSQNCLLNHLQAWLKHPSHYFLFVFYTKIHHPFFLFARVGYKCLPEMMKMAKIDFQIMKFVTIEDI